MADFKTPSPDSPAHSQLLQQQQEANPTPVPPPPTSAALDPSPPSYGVSSDRKRRGRPRGSKNRPKPPVYITPRLPCEPAVKLMHLCIPAGNDVVDMLQNFARSKRVGLQVLNGSGSISGPSGVFNLVTLRGAFVDSAAAPWLTIFVGGNATDGVLRGTVVSKLLAATDVVVNVILFKSGGDQLCYRLEPEMLARMDQSGFANVPSCSGGVVVGGAMPMSAAWFGLPAPNLNWALPTASAAQPPNHHFMSFKN